MEPPIDSLGNVWVGTGPASTALSREDRPCCPEASRRDVSPCAAARFGEEKNRATLLQPCEQSCGARYPVDRVCRTFVTVATHANIQERHRTAGRWGFGNLTRVSRRLAVMAHYDHRGGVGPHVRRQV